MAREKTRVFRTPAMVLTEHGHVVNKWCGSCAHKDIQSASTGTVDGQRHCTKLDIIVEIDDICREWELDEKLAAL